MASAQIYGDPTKRLELYFRPKDPYCHPVCANRFSTSSLLLRVRRKTKQGLPGPEARPQVTFDVEILGTVPTIYRFQGNYRCILTELGDLRACVPTACRSLVGQPHRDVSQDVSTGLRSWK